MPLSSVNFVPVTGSIKAADMLQFYNLFTGVMTDQPVTFGNTLTIGGSQSVGAAPLRIGGVIGQTANMLEVRDVSTDVQPAFAVGPTGALAWGPGGAVGTDVSLSRSAANQLTVTGVPGTPAFVVSAGGLQVTAGNVGISAAPVARALLNIGSGGTVTTLGTTQYGIQSSAAFSSAATVEATAVAAQMSTTAASFTVASGTDFHALNPAKGAGSVITSAYGLLVDPITAGGTNNYGIYVNTPSGGSGTNIGIAVAGNGSQFGIQVGGGGEGYFRSWSYGLLSLNNSYSVFPGRAGDGTLVGMLLLFAEGSSPSLGLFAIGGPASPSVNMIFGTGVYSTTVGTANHVNVYWSGSDYVIQNLFATENFSATWIGN